MYRSGQSINSSKVIESERLLLRPMGAADVDDLLRIFSDPKVMASFGGILFDRPQMTRWMQRNLDHQAEYGYGLISVIHKADGLLIGDCGLGHVQVNGIDVVELGYGMVKLEYRHLRHPHGRLLNEPRTGLARIIGTTTGRTAIGG